MLELAALLALFFSYALLYAAQPKRLRAARFRFARLPVAGHRILALASSALGVALWAQTESLAAALLVATAALTASATLFALLAPLWPRAAWGAALCCPALIVLLSLLGGLDG